MRRMLSEDSAAGNVINNNNNDIKAINSTIKPIVNNSITTDKISDENITKDKTSVTIDSNKELNIAPKNVLKDTGTNKNIPPQKKDISNTQPSIEVRKENQTIKELKTTPGLPSGWQKMVDQKSGKVYYIDHNTKTTHWVLPDGILDKNFPTTVVKANQNNIQQPSNHSPRSQSTGTKRVVSPAPVNGELVLPGSNKTHSPKPNGGTSTTYVDAKLPKNTVPTVAVTPQKPPPLKTIDPSIGPVLKPPQQFSNPEMPPAQNTVGTEVRSPKAVTRPPQQQIPPQQPKQIHQPQKPNTSSAQTPPKQSVNIPPHKPNTPDQQGPSASIPPNKPIISVQPQPSVPGQDTINKPPNMQTIPSIPKQPKPHLDLREDRKIPPASHGPKDTMDVPKQPSLKRSLSSPNLADNLASIKANKPKTPIVDRGSKPL